MFSSRSDANAGRVGFPLEGRSPIERNVMVTFLPAKAEGCGSLESCGGRESDSSVSPAADSVDPPGQGRATAVTHVEGPERGTQADVLISKQVPFC